MKFSLILCDVMVYTLVMHNWDDEDVLDVLHYYLTVGRAIGRLRNF